MNSVNGELTAVRTLEPGGDPENSERGGRVPPSPPRNENFSSQADVSSVSPSSERIEELWVVCGLYIERWSYATGWCLVT